MAEVEKRPVAAFSFPAVRPKSPVERPVEPGTEALSSPEPAPSTISRGRANVHHRRHSSYGHFIPNLAPCVPLPTTIHSVFPTHFNTCSNIHSSIPRQPHQGSSPKGSAVACVKRPLVLKNRLSNGGPRQQQVASGLRNLNLKRCIRTTLESSSLDSTAVLEWRGPKATVLPVILLHTNNTPNQLFQPRTPHRTLPPPTPPGRPPSITLRRRTDGLRS